MKPLALSAAMVVLCGGLCLAIPLRDDSSSLVQNPTFEQRSGNTPANYALDGEATYQFLGDAHRDASTWGVALHSRGHGRGGVSQVVVIPAGEQRAYRFDFRGLPQDGFTIGSAGHLLMRVEFLDDGNKSYDSKQRDIYDAVLKARKDLTVNGDNHVAGAATWQTYSMEFVVPFAQVTRVKIGVMFDGARSVGNGASDFYVDDFDLTPIAVPAVQMTGAAHGFVVALDHILPIGGKWYYAARGDESTVPSTFNYQNGDRLLYYDGQYSTPFAGNMSTWLRAGDKDLSGNIVLTDTFVPDNVVVSFDQSSLIVHTHILPNHPTGKFPQEGRGNPNFIAEQDETYYLPLNPQERANHIVTDKTNTNRALNMGPIGIATNGVVFFNPFDMGNTDATSFMDACCGHPNQDGEYHYHKYPICVNTPWSDEGTGHSPLLGWAFDGFPIYGPYEDKDEMAKNVSGKNALNGFNMHYDEARGWHYHVTPGQFPYIIGGYWGTPDPRDVRPPHKMNGGNAQGPGGPGGPGGFGGQQGPGNGPPNGPGPMGFGRRPPPGPPPF